MCIPDTVKARIRDLETSFQSGVNNKHGGSAYICWIQTVIVLIYWDNYRKSCELQLMMMPRHVGALPPFQTLS